MSPLTLMPIIYGSLCVSSPVLTGRVVFGVVGTEELGRGVVVGLGVIVTGGVTVGVGFPDGVGVTGGVSVGTGSLSFLRTAL